MAQATGPARPASSRPRPAAGGPEANKYIKKARRRPPAGKIRACKHASRASKIRHANRAPARRRRGGNTFPDRWLPRRAERLSPTGVYPPCRRNRPARATHAKSPPPRRIHSFTLGKRHMKKRFFLIFAAFNVILLFISIPMTTSSFANIGINANYHRVTQKLASTNIPETDKQQIKSIIDKWKNDDKLEYQNEENNKIHLRLLILGYVILCSGMIFYFRKQQSA